MMMQAELINQNGQQLLKLPENIRFNSPAVYICQNEQTGSLTVSESPWEELWGRLQTIGPVEELPDEG